MFLKYAISLVELIKMAKILKSAQRETVKMKDFKEFSKSRWICPQPFVHGFSDGKGRWCPCCVANDTFLASGQQYPVNNYSLKDWHSSDYVEELRDHMLSENPDFEFLESRCGVCVKSEKITGKSIRTRHLEQYTNSKNKEKSLTEAIENHVAGKETIGTDLRFLNLQLRIFGNFCNLGCYMCHPVNSSKRQKDIKNLPDDLTDEIKSKDLVYSKEKIKTDDIVDQIVSIAKNVKLIKIIGGEPILMVKHYELLKKLIECGEAKNIILVYHTNLTKLKTTKIDFFEYSDHFKEIFMTVSLESLKERNGYIRKGSHIQTIINNIETIKSKNITVNFGLSVTMLSVFDLKYTIDELAKMGLYGVSYYIVKEPEFLHIRHLPDSIKSDLINEFVDYPDIVHALRLQRDENRYKKAIDYCLALEKQYPENGELYENFPELVGY